jgi:hypothetical protein
MQHRKIDTNPFVKSILKIIFCKFCSCSICLNTRNVYFMREYKCIFYFAYCNTITLVGTDRFRLRNAFTCFEMGYLHISVRRYRFQTSETKNYNHRSYVVPFSCVNLWTNYHYSPYCVLCIVCYVTLHCYRQLKIKMEGLHIKSYLPRHQYLRLVFVFITLTPNDL